MLLKALILLSALCYSISAHLILKPPATAAEGKNVLLVYVPGVLALPEQYEVKISKAQKAAAESGIRLWSVVPKFTFNVWALSQQVRSAIESALVAAQEEMITDGALAGADDKMTVFYAGHSRGGVSMQEVFGGLFKNNALLSNSFRVQRNAAASDDKESPILKHNVAGLMFFGVSLSRKYRNSTDNFVADLPSLTVGAELDGLYRITRVAETFWYYLNGATDEESILRHPVFVMRGGSHRSFVHGKSSFFVNLNDLEPEITEEASSDYLSSVISNFIVYQVSDRSSSESLRAKSDLLAEHEQSKGYYQPIVDALLLEGSYNLKPACSDVPAGTNCWKGCEWTEHIQKHVSSLSVSPIVEDSFFKVWKIPFHLPKFNAKCEKNDPNCVVRSETVTELKYGLLNGLDTGFDLTASSEMKVKLSSRQAMLEASGEKNVNFTATDDYDTFCAELNQVAFDYALKIADSAALKRYFTKGAMLTFGKDLGPYVGGVQWIWKSLEFKKYSAHNGKLVAFNVLSPNMRTPTDYIVPLAAGFHYCKLISPARALEWIYVDSLKNAK